MNTKVVSRTSPWGPNTKHYEFAIVETSVPTNYPAVRAFEITKTEYVTYPNGEGTPAGKHTFPPSTAFLTAEGVYCWILDPKDVRVIDLDTAADYAIDTLPEFNTARQEAANRKYNEESIAAYRKSQRGRKVSAEERYELRVAFGPGTTVVNVFTGWKIRV
jgi:hypothetical protein